MKKTLKDSKNQDRKEYPPFLPFLSKKVKKKLLFCCSLTWIVDRQALNQQQNLLFNDFFCIYVFCKRLIIKQVNKQQSIYCSFNK